MDEEIRPADEQFNAASLLFILVILNEATDWAMLRDFNCSTRIPVNSVAKVLTPQSPSG